jgi:hypothetical protein
MIVTLGATIKIIRQIAMLRPAAAAVMDIATVAEVATSSQM